MKILFCRLENKYLGVESGIINLLFCHPLFSVFITHFCDSTCRSLWAPGQTQILKYPTLDCIKRWRYSLSPIKPVFIPAAARSDA